MSAQHHWLTGDDAEELRRRPGSVAHDMNNLIAVAFGYLEEIERLAPGPGGEAATRGLREALGEAAKLGRALFEERCAAANPARLRPAHTGTRVPGHGPGEGRSSHPGGSVLIIDDDPSVRALTARVLRSLGLEAVDRGEVEAAFAYLEREAARTGTVLVDAMMPGPGIVQVCSRLRALNPGGQILVMSGAQAVADEVAGLANGFIAKPFTVAELRAALLPAGLGAAA